MDRRKPVVKEMLKKILLGSVCGIFYLAALYLTGFYVTVSLDKSVTLFPIAEIILLCGAALLIFTGSRTLSLTLMRAKTEPLMKVTVWIVFIIYLMLLLNFTLFDEYFGRTEFRLIFTAPDDITGIYTKTSLNLIPFKNIGNFTVKFLSGQLSSRFFLTNVVGNLLAFAPMAVFLPLISERCKKPLPFTLTVGVGIVLIEVAQILLLTGFCDIDDLILNLGGALVVYAILRIPVPGMIISRIAGLTYHNKSELS